MRWMTRLTATGIAVVALLASGPVAASAHFVKGNLQATDAVDPSSGSATPSASSQVAPAPAPLPDLQARTNAERTASRRLPPIIDSVDPWGSTDTYHPVLARTPTVFPQGAKAAPRPASVPRRVPLVLEPIDPWESPRASSSPATPPRTTAPREMAAPAPPVAPTPAAPSEPRSEPGSPRTEADRALRNAIDAALDAGDLDRAEKLLQVWRATR